MNPVTVGPSGWDGESYCVGEGCCQPATREYLTGMFEDLPIVEMLCEACASRHVAPFVVNVERIKPS
jgi:hypothetical protein